MQEDSWQQDQEILTSLHPRIGWGGGFFVALPPFVCFVWCNEPQTKDQKSWIVVLTVTHEL